MTMQTNEFPWDDLPKPESIDYFVSRLVSEDENPEDRRIFWARSWRNNPALLIEYQDDSWEPDSLPSFKSMQVTDFSDENTLVVELLDAEMGKQFLDVCLDIIDALQGVPEKACRRACVLRLERWSSFFRPARSKLSSEAQRGLIAELRFLGGEALERLGPDNALAGWVGPEGSPRDFSYGQVFVEVKSKRSSANPKVVISSEEQLNASDSEQVFLYVIELNDAPTDAKEAFSLNDVVAETKAAFDSPLRGATLDNKLAEVGYFDEDDYSDSKWSEGGSYCYAVVEGFPKIDSRSCAPGVSCVTYSLDLDYCDSYLVESSEILKALE